MHATVKKWGNSAAVRIPQSLLRSLKWNIEDSINVREESGKIIIEPLRDEEYRLADLLDGITENNLHDEVDFGPSVGREAR